MYQQSAEKKDILFHSDFVVEKAQNLCVFFFARSGILNEIENCPKFLPRTLFHRKNRPITFANTVTYTRNQGILGLFTKKEDSGKTLGCWHKQPRSKYSQAIKREAIYLRRDVGPLPQQLP